MRNKGGRIVDLLPRDQLAPERAPRTTMGRQISHIPPFSEIYYPTHLPKKESDSPVFQGEVTFFFRASIHAYMQF